MRTAAFDSLPEPPHPTPVNNLPNDPFMLFSVINTYLRDRYASLQDLCDDLQVDRGQLEDRLAQAGFVYNPAQNKFW